MLLQLSIFHYFHGAPSFYAFLANGTATPHMTQAPQLSFHLCTNAEKHQVLFFFSHGKYICEVESGTSSPPTLLLSGKLDLLVPSPTPQDPSPSLFTHLCLPCPLCPQLSQNSETNIISHQVDFIFIMNLCSWYNSQCVYCWPVRSGKTPEDF